MCNAYDKRGRWIFLVMLGITLLACNLGSSQTGNTQVSPPPDAPTPTLFASATTGPSPAAATGTEIATSTATSTVGPPPSVTVSAVGGRLNVRRGPGPEYDIVGAIRDGDSTVAAARNQDGSWLLINTPNTSKMLGWIIVTTKYTAVSGAAAALPVSEMGPAIPAYIRNCTPNEMLVNPTGETLSDRSTAPENELQFFPGEYTIVDTETEIEVASVTVLEGRTIDIKTDGSGSSFKCP